MPAATLTGDQAAATNPPLGQRATSWWQLATITFFEWLDDQGPMLGAALAYYTVFSMAPLLVISIAMAEPLFQKDEVRTEIKHQLDSMLGEEGSKGVLELVDRVQKQESGATASLIGLGMLLIGASGVFGQLKVSLNQIWDVKPKPSNGVIAFVKDRFLSFTMVLGVGFLLLVLLIVSAFISAAQAWFAGIMPLPGFVAQVIDLLVSFGVVTLLFGMIFRVLPDAEIAWYDVWLGAAVTALLFSLGKFAIGMYLGRASVGSTYGAAGTIVIVMLWAYYSAQILLFGAEFTQVYSRSFGSRRGVAKTLPPEGKG
jgi:membrane protein